MLADQFHRLHFIGIKGVGMSALAIVAQGLGYQVHGSDSEEEFITDSALLAAGVPFHNGFAAEHLDPATDLVVAGAAYGENNPEYAEALRRNLPIWTYSDMLGYLSKQKKTIAIAGTHGKTTTTSITASLFYHAGLQPSYVIGTGHVSQLPSHGLAGAGDYFIVEADDYKKAPNNSQPKFLDLEPTVGVITSVEHDHPDMYPSLRDCLEAFYQFALRVKSNGFLVVNGDDPQIAWIRNRIADRRFVTFGFNDETDYKIISLPDEGVYQAFNLQTKQGLVGPFKLQLPGVHNLMNATAALVVSLELGLDVTRLQQNLPIISGVERRYQLVGENNSVTVIDDYAHHPTAVALTLETAKKQFPNRPLWCFFQAHTYSRTQALLKEFGEAFTAADVVIITDIFGSAREQAGGVSAHDLVKEIGKHHKNVMYVAFGQLLQFMQRNLPPQAVVITMGAGDIYKIGHQLVGDKD